MLQGSFLNPLNKPSASFLNTLAWPYPKRLWTTLNLTLMYTKALASYSSKKLLTHQDQQSDYIMFNNLLLTEAFIVKSGLQFTDGVHGVRPSSWSSLMGSEWRPLRKKKRQEVSVNMSDHNSHDAPLWAQRTDASDLHPGSSQSSESWLSPGTWSLCPERDGETSAGPWDTCPLTSTWPVPMTTVNTS